MKTDEEAIREKVRKSIEELDTSLSDSRVPENGVPHEDLRIREITERIVAEETERHFTAKGLVKYVSSTGRVYWLTPEERDHRLASRQHRRSKRKRKKLPRAIDRKKALALFFFLVVVVLVVWLLFATGVFNIPER